MSAVHFYASSFDSTGNSVGKKLMTQLGKGCLPAAICASQYPETP